MKRLPIGLLVMLSACGNVTTAGRATAPATTATEVQLTDEDVKFLFVTFVKSESSKLSTVTPIDLLTDSEIENVLLQMCKGFDGGLNSDQLMEILLSMSGWPNTSDGTYMAGAFVGAAESVCQDLR